MSSNLSQTPSAKRRRALLAASRARGKKNANLWYVYSIKTDRDWLLQSDREIVHLIRFLETDKQVASFDLAPDPMLSYDDSEARETEPDAHAIYVDGHVEYHEVKAGRVTKDADRPQLLAQSAAAQTLGTHYRKFNDTDLAPYCQYTVRWLKPIAYAAMLRDQAQAPCRDALLAVTKNTAQGTVRSLVNALPQFDPAVVIGMLVRLAICGPLQVDLSGRSFGYTTPWRWCDDN